MLTEEFYCWGLLTESAVKTPHGWAVTLLRRKESSRKRTGTIARPWSRRVWRTTWGLLVRDRFARDRGRPAETRRLATSGSNSFKAFNTRLNSWYISYYTPALIVRAIYGTPRYSHATGERSGELGKSGTNVLIYPDVCTHIHVRACLYMIHINMYISRRFIAAETEELRTWFRANIIFISRLLLLVVDFIRLFNFTLYRLIVFLLYVLRFFLSQRDSIRSRTRNLIW